jgi:hypothetical protein
MPFLDITAAADLTVATAGVVTDRLLRNSLKKAGAPSGVRPFDLP